MHVAYFNYHYLHNLIMCLSMDCLELARYDAKVFRVSLKTDNVHRHRKQIEDLQEL